MGERQVAPQEIVEGKPQEVLEGARAHAPVFQDQLIELAGLLKNGEAQVVATEGGEFSIELTPKGEVELHNRLETQAAREKYERERAGFEAVHKDTEGKSVKEVFDRFPELKEQLELIPIAGTNTKREGEEDKEGKLNEVFLLRLKNIPQFAVPIYSSEFGTAGKVQFGVYSDPRIKAGHVALTKEFQVICMCCRPGSQNKTNPHPRPSFRTDDERTQWFETDDGKEHDRWIKKQETAFRKELKALCRDNGITVLAVRHSDLWDKQDSYYSQLSGGTLKDVQLVEVTDDEALRTIISHMQGKYKVEPNDSKESWLYSLERDRKNKKSSPEKSLLFVGSTGRKFRPDIK